MSSKFVNYSTLDSEHNGKDLRIQLRTDNTLPNHNEIMGGPIFVESCFVMNLLMQHKFCCVDIMGRSQRTKKTNTHVPCAHVGHSRKFIKPCEKECRVSFIHL